MCVIVPPTLALPYIICLGAAEVLVATFVPKFSAVAFVPFDIKPPTRVEAADNDAIVKVLTPPKNAPVNPT